jgi:hypothetical protein
MEKVNPFGSAGLCFGSFGRRHEKAGQPSSARGSSSCPLWTSRINLCRQVALQVLPRGTPARALGSAKKSPATTSGRPDARGLLFGRARMPVIKRGIQPFYPTRQLPQRQSVPGPPKEPPPRRWEHRNGGVVSQSELVPQRNPDSCAGRASGGRARPVGRKEYREPRRGRATLSAHVHREYCEIPSAR